jgi:hypothetical protein
MAQIIAIANQKGGVVKPQQPLILLLLWRF